MSYHAASDTASNCFPGCVATSYLVDRQPLSDSGACWCTHRNANIVNLEQVERIQSVKQPLLCVDFGSLGPMGLIGNPYQLLLAVMNAVTSTGWYDEDRCGGYGKHPWVMDLDICMQMYICGFSCLWYP